MAKPTNIDFIRETLRDLGETTAKEIQKATGLSSSTVSDNLRKLVSQGLVERSEGHDEHAAGNGTVVLWRVLDEYEQPAGADEPPVNPADVAEALDEIATHQGERPTVVPAAYKGDHQGAAVVELPDEPVLDPAAPIVVDDQRPQSVADVLADDQLPAHSVDLNVMEPADETPADGHWPTADEVDAGVAEWERQRQLVDRSNFDREVQLGSPIAHEATCGTCGETFNPSGPDDMEHVERADGTPCGGQADPESYGTWHAPSAPASVEQAHAEALEIVADDLAARTSAEPASSDPGDVLAYMQAVRPVSPAPIGEPAPTPRPRRARSTSSSGEQRDTSAFYKRGALSEQIAQWMREHADQSYGPSEVAKALSAQTGSVGYAMDKLHQQGALQLTQAKPKRYQANAAE